MQPASPSCTWAGCSASFSRRRVPCHHPPWCRSRLAWSSWGRPAYIIDRHPASSSAAHTPNAPSAAAGCMGSLLDARNASCDLPQDRTRRIGRCIRQFGNRREEPTQQQDNQDSDVETHCPGLRVRARRRCMTTSAATRSSPGMAARPLASLCYTMLNDGAKALSWSHL